MNQDNFKPLLDLLSGQFGWLPLVLGWIAALRLALKPVGLWVQMRLTAMVDSVNASEDVEDDARLLAILDSRFYRAFAFTTDLLFSLKLPSAASLVQHLEQKSGPWPPSAGGGPKTGGMAFAALLFLVLPLALGSGCAHFTTTQTDLSYEEGKPTRTVTTRASASTLFTAKSALANFKAAQTDKTQGASVGQLTQETSGTNAVRTLEALAAILNAVK